MKKILIDTNIYSAFKRDNKEVIKMLKKAEMIAISPTILGEIYAGFKLGNREKQNLVELEKFLDSPRVAFLLIDEVTSDYYASIFKQLKMSGTPIPANDIWIAAIAMQYGLAIFTLDKHFDNIDGLLLK